MKHAIYPGSFDPVTYGHIDIIKRAAEMFDELTVGVIVNPSKISMFTEQERVDMIKEVTKDLSNVKVDTFKGLLADYVNQGDFDLVVRGLRATTDFEYEIQMAQMNARLFNKGVESVFLMTSPEYSFISSSMIKEVVSLHGDAEGLVPDIVLEKMKEKFEELEK